MAANERCMLWKLWCCSLYCIVTWSAPKYGYWKEIKSRCRDLLKHFIFYVLKMFKQIKLRKGKHNFSSWPFLKDSSNVCFQGLFRRFFVSCRHSCKNNGHHLCWNKQVVPFLNVKSSSKMGCCSPLGNLNAFTCDDAIWVNQWEQDREQEKMWRSRSFKGAMVVWLRKPLPVLLGGVVTMAALSRLMSVQWTCKARPLVNDTSVKRNAHSGALGYAAGKEWADGTHKCSA